MILGGQSLYVLEMQPASYAILATNEAEKAANITVVDYKMMGATGRVYLLPRGGSELRVLVDKGPLGSAQGMAWTPDGQSLFVADYTQGIAKVAAATGAVSLLDAPADAVLTGIDGLVWADGNLVGIQNGVRPHRVVRLRLDAALERIEEVSTLERANSHFNEPTLGIRVDDIFYYIANSQYEYVREDGTLALDKLQPPVILSTRLPWIVSPPKP